MAIYRNIHLSFWTDNKVEDEFTPEDKYFYLYLLTNPQTNICGCYEISYSQMSHQTGYNKDTINRLLERFQKVHSVIKYSKDTKEVLILHWYKYNWNKSEKTLIGVENVAKHIKFKPFKDYVLKTVSSIRDEDFKEGDMEYEVEIKKCSLEKERMWRDFEIIYSHYPKKIGKARGYDYYKSWIKGRNISGEKIKLTNKQIWDAIEKYRIEVETFEKKFIKNFDTFMNKSILDYVEDLQ